MRKSCDIVLSFIFNSLVNGGPNFFILCSCDFTFLASTTCFKKTEFVLRQGQEVLFVLT